VASGSGVRFASSIPMMFLFFIAFCLPDYTAAVRSSIAVGLLHSKTGSWAASELPILEAEKLAIAEINAAGGLLGSHVASTEFDGASSPNAFAQGVTTLYATNRVAAIFGGGSSASRQSMIAPLDQVTVTGTRLLFYPLAYEGQECSRNVIYGGSVPNQQIEPAVDWATETLGRNVYLLGSDDAFSRTAHAIIKAQLAATGSGAVVGEELVSAQSTTLDTMRDSVAAIRQALPTGGVVLNSLFLESGLMFEAMYTSSPRVSPDNGFHVLSFRVGDSLSAALPAAWTSGSFSSWSYFPSNPSVTNDYFVSTLASRRAGQFGGNASLVPQPSDAMASAYTLVKLWAAAVTAAQSFDNDKVRAALYGMRVQGPSGQVMMNR
jgi:urea transport system substrate-binding protein